MRQESIKVLGEVLGKALTVELVDPYMGPRYPCRPVVARSVERHTAFGVFSGQIGLSALPEFSAAMRELCTDNISKLILDFSQLSLTKSAAGSLVAFAAAMHGRNKKLYLYNASPQIRGLLHELALTSFFHLLESEEDIIATLEV